MATQPTLCAGGCGFFGNEAFQNYCSKCFKEHVPQQEKPAEVQKPPQEEKKEEEVKPSKPVQENTTRCWTCKAKIGLTGFHCRCDYYFCSKHRYSDQHACDFDYKTAGRDALAKANQTVVATKIEKL